MGDEPVMPKFAGEWCYPDCTFLADPEADTPHCDNFDADLQREPFTETYTAENANPSNIHRCDDCKGL